MANLITLADYKQIEGLTNPKDDFRISQLIDSVSQLVKTYCGNSIVDHYTTNKVEVFNIDWATHIIQLTESPIKEIVSVQKRDSVTESYTTVATTDYYLDSTTDSVLYVTGSTYKNWPRGAGSVKVTYKAGYSTCPTDLRLAVVDLIKYYMKDEHVMRRTMAGASIENQGTGETRGFPDHIKRILDMYKTL